MTRYGGIDPGLDGYVAVIGGVEAWAEPTPTLPTGKGAKRLYNLSSMWELARQLRGLEVSLVMLEKSQPMPGQGVTSTFSTGYGFGLWEMALTAAGVPYELVRPGAWKKAMGISVTGQGLNGAARKKQSKALAIAKAQAMFPGHVFVPPGKRVPSADMAEALLLATYAAGRCVP